MRRLSSLECTLIHAHMRTFKVETEVLKLLLSLAFWWLCDLIFMKLLILTLLSVVKQFKDLVSLHFVHPKSSHEFKRSLNIESFQFIFFPRLSVSTWKIMVELRKFFDAFFEYISKTTVSFNLHAEKKDQFMLLKEFKFSNSKFYQSLVQGDLTLSN